MTTIPSSPTTDAAAGTPSPAGTLPSTGLGLDKDAFLRLLVEQLRNQDPTQPGDSDQYVNQMTQYSILEQLTNLNDAATAQAGDASVGKAVALIGHAVSYRADDGTTQSGTVERVEIADDGPTLTVSGQAGIAPADLVEVR